MKCERNPHARPGETDPDKLFYHSSVYSRDLVYAPQPGQGDVLGDEESPRPVLDDILIAKLRPGQEIVCEMHCEKGVGSDHAKWSPVGQSVLPIHPASKAEQTLAFAATASYRLLPSIDLRQPIPSADCARFAACFPPGVISVDVGSNGQLEATVANPRLDTVSREVLRHKAFADKVILGRKRDHFICKD